MEVTNENFFKEFPTILKHIANASFVAINVVMSGCDRVIFNDAAKSSLQHYYDLIKEDADKYHMLQLGLTLIEEDTSTGTFIFLDLLLAALPPTSRPLRVSLPFLT